MTFTLKVDRMKMLDSACQRNNEPFCQMAMTHKITVFVDYATMLEGCIIRGG
jgi:hypothetical protein